MYLTSRVNSEQSRRAERKSQRRNAFSVNLRVASTQMSTRRTSTNKLWGGGGSESGLCDRSQKNARLTVREKKERRQNTDLWRFWWCCPGIIDDSKRVPALITTWAQNLSVGFRRNDGPDERSEKLLRYRIINVLWEPRTPISEERQPVLTPRSVSLFSIFYGQIKIYI